MINHVGAPCQTIVGWFKSLNPSGEHFSLHSPLLEVCLWASFHWMVGKKRENKLK